MLDKYLKPKSLTWWAGLVPIAAGVFVATAPLHKMTELANVISAMYGDVPPSVPINAGLALIGLRGAV